MSLGYNGSILVIRGETVSKATSNFIWKYSIQKNDELGMFLQVECTPKGLSTHWECDLFVSIAEFTMGCETPSLTPTFKTESFSNSARIAKMQLLDNVISVLLGPDERRVHFYDFTRADLYDEPVEHISDIKLIVEGQEMYACKKILAIYSTFFCDLFYGDQGDRTMEKFELEETSYNSFLVFLGLLYSQKNLLNVRNITEVSYLSTRFKVDHCRVECEKFIINENNISPTCKLGYAQDYNFKVLNYRVLSNCHTFEDVMALGTSLNFEYITPEAKIAIMDRMIQLKKGEQMNPDDGKFTERYISFTEGDADLDDIVLSVEDRKFNVSKQLLAHNSSYFYTLFYSDFYEKGKNEIELKEIVADEFKVFLQFIYSPENQVREKNFMGLLKLSDMYNVQWLLRKCETYLKVDNKMSDVDKIKLAEKHNFQNLIEQIASKIKNYNDFQKLSEQDGFYYLEKATIGQIALNLVKKK